MTKPLIAIINVQTQEEIVREMTDEEYVQHLKDIADEEAVKITPAE